MARVLLGPTFAEFVGQMLVPHDHSDIHITQILTELYV